MNPFHKAVANARLAAQGQMLPIFIEYFIFGIHHQTPIFHNLLDSLNNIRLAALIEAKTGRGKPRVSYQLEQMDTQESALAKALGIGELHTNRPKISQIGVYTD